MNIDVFKFIAGQVMGHGVEVYTWKLILKVRVTYLEQIK